MQKFDYGCPYNSYNSINRIVGPATLWYLAYIDFIGNQEYFIHSYVIDTVSSTA